MKILITGATGFVGRNLVPYLFEHTSKDICLLVRDKKKVMNSFLEVSKYSIITTEIDDWQKQVIAYSPDIVLHLATYFTNKCDAKNAMELIDSNILFTAYLLEAVSKTNCKCFINTGTFSEFGYGAGEFLPNTLYSATKTAVRSLFSIIKLFRLGIGLI